jgi:hypothetical protein
LLLHADKTEWWREMEQERTKWKNDRGQEWETMKKELDSLRLERFSKEKGNVVVLRPWLFCLV